MTPLNVLVAADPELPVPTPFYGGIERIIDLFVRGLVARGHRVALLAHAASEPACELIPYAGHSSGSVSDSFTNARRLAREVRRRRPDIVQSFGRLAYLAPILRSAVPKVMSYHRHVTAARVRWASRLAGGTLRYTGISRYIVNPVKTYGQWTVIYNAIPVHRYRFSPAVEPDAPLVFLGRIEHIKGTHIAIDVAKAAGRRLVIAGNVPDEPVHAAYFKTAIAPHIDGSAISYVGPVDDASKGELLGRAAALLMPVLWDEPFGLVMAEALACGTPVIAFDRGAVREVVDDGVTGVVCESPAAMIRALDRLPDLDRRACRAQAEARFAPDVLVDAYESLYGDIMHRRAS